MNSEDVVFDESFDFEFGGAVDACADESLMPPALSDEVEKRIEAHFEAFDLLRWEICAPENNLDDDYFHELDIDSLGIPPEGPSGEPSDEAPGRPAWRNYRLGSHVLDEAYSILCRRVVEYDLGCLFATETTGNATSVVVCNSWRLTKHANSPEIRIEVKDFDSGGWVAGDTWDLPDIMLLPGTPKRKMARQVLHRAAHVFSNTFHGRTTAERTVLADVSESETWIFTLHSAFADATVRSFEKRLGAKKLNSLSETLSKILWKELLDPAFIRVVRCARKFRTVSFSDYMWMARSHSTWTRFYKQERRLLPLFLNLHVDELKKSEPFSIRRWTEEGVQFAWPCQNKIRLSGPASYRALIATHPAIVREWAEMSCKNGAFSILFDVQARIADDGRIPQPVMWSLLEALGSHGYGQFEQNELEQLARLIRQYVRECKRRQALTEFRTYRNAIDSIGLCQVLDWWVHAGIPADEPNRQTKWSGIERKSSQWHRVVWQVPSISKDLVWESLVSACDVSGVDVEPLTSSDSLIAEGKAMQHCVSAYDAKCIGGEYRIFSLKAKTGGRTTLGLARGSDRWNVDQHVSAANGPISSSLAAVGEEIACLYTKVDRTTD